MFALSERKNIRLVITALTFFFLTACGGGNSDFDSSVTSGSEEGAPTLISVEITTTPSEGVLGNGDMVTVTMEASETILAPSVLIADDAADSVTGSGTDWIAVREMVAGDPDGPITVSINITDITGVSGTSVNTTSTFTFQNPDPLQLNEESSDEFSGVSLSTDPTTGWSFENGDGSAFGIPGWGNNELQIYSEDQIAVVDGNLVITANESSGSTKTTVKIGGETVSQATQGDFVSGRIRSNTVVDMSQPAGRVEVRAKMPFGQGIWPAIWMLPTQDVVDEYGIWPLTGEIDIVEATNLGVDGKQTIQSTIHYGFPFPDNSFDFDLYEPGLNPQDDFNVYAMEWETTPADTSDPENVVPGSGEIRFYFNDVHYASHSSDRWFAVDEEGNELPDPAPFDKTFNVLINLAVGGNLSGNPDDTTVFPQVLEVDYVRVFDCEFPEAGECSVGIDESIQPRPPEGAIETQELVVFDDEINSEIWVDGVFAFDGALGFADCFGNEDCVSINWNIVAAEDTSRGQVYQVDYPVDSGDPENPVGFAGLILGSNREGIDLSNFATGDIIFDLNVSANPASAAFTMKIDCVDCPVDAGQREQNLGVPTIGEWTEITVPVSDLINASGGPTVGGLTVDSVTTGLVIFPAFGSTAGVSYQIDNIRWVAGAVSEVGTGDVYDDALDERWANGLIAFDEAINFGDCIGNGGADCPSLSWAEVAADDASRGTVLEVTYEDDAQFAGMIVGKNDDGLDLSSFASGLVIFDLNLISNPSDANFTMKIDCDGCPVSAGEREQDLGVPVSGWQTFEVEVADLVNANGGPTSGGLNLETVTTGLVIFPTFGNTAGVQYQLDNVRWESSGGTDPGDGGDGGIDESANDGTVENPVINFDNVLGTYNLSDFGGAISSLVMDPDDSMNTVVGTTRLASAETFAGTTLNNGLIVFPLTLTDTIMTVRVYSPAIGLTVLLKLEESETPENFVQTESMTTVADAWETLTFDFGSPTEGTIDESFVYDELSIFFNFGATGAEAGEQLFYWDDVTFVGGTGSSQPTATGAVYDDALDSQWADGLSAFDQAIGFSSCANDGGAGCPSVNWAEVAAADVSRGTVIEVTYDGAAQFAGLIIGLEEDGLDLSDYASGSVKFDLMVTANPSDAAFIMKVDCVGCPTDAGQREQNLGTPTLNNWDEFSIPVADLINANGGPDTGGLVIDSVTTGLVIFPAFGSTAGVEYQIDNIRWVIEDSAVYDDALDSQWADGLSAFDQAIGFSSCANDGGAGCPSVNWAEVAAADVSRGTVIEVTYDGAAQFAGLIIGLEEDGLDLSDYASGSVKFDLMVTANPSDAAFIMKVDCVGCPTDAGQREQNLGTPTLNNWDEFSIPVADLINANGGPDTGGLVIDSVTTGLVIFPAFGSTAGVEYQIDNIRWTAE